MELNEIFNIEKYTQAYEFVRKNGYIIKEIERAENGERRFQVLQRPAPTEEDVLNQLRSMREKECFSVINRGNVWYETLRVEEYIELKDWYQKWLNVTQTKIIPEKPNWIK